MKYFKLAVKCGKDEEAEKFCIIHNVIKLVCVKDVILFATAFTVCINKVLAIIIAAVNRTLTKLNSIFMHNDLQL